MGNRVTKFEVCSIEVKKACPIETTLSILKGKWKGIIISILSEQAVRFNELKRLIPGITQRILTLQLKELEEDGIVNRDVEYTVPRKVEYSLTEQGKALFPVIEGMRNWGTRYLDSNIDLDLN
ncbi:helix-turn-helix domain-containing protein [Halobacillus rhizosphaerae]|uniref:winged helix-turn-helix transcriptional regulator n=1 Tax=Halobacillus rhizosphaerae TaxID=3064889 RepID=UPI00398AF061